MEIVERCICMPEWMYGSALAITTSLVVWIIIIALTGLIRAIYKK